MSAQNGNGTIWKYLLGAVLSITLPIAGYAFTSSLSAVDVKATDAKSDSKEAKEIAEKASEKADKVEVIEVEIKYLREDVKRIEGMLQRDFERYHREH